MNPIIEADRVLTVDAAAATPPLNSQNGLLFDADGRLVITSTAPVAVFLNGLPLSSDGKLCVSST